MGGSNKKFTILLGYIVGSKLAPDTLKLSPKQEKDGKGREGKGREGKGREGKGREGKGREKGREGKGREGKGREGKGREGKGRGVSISRKKNAKI